MKTVLVYNKLRGTLNRRRSIQRAAWYFRGCFHIEQIVFALNVEDVELTHAQVRRVLNRVAHKNNNQGWYNLSRATFWTLSPDDVKGRGINAFHLRCASGRFTEEFFGSVQNRAADA